MTGLLTAIDHLVLGVGDLAGAEKIFSRLGFRMGPAGIHTGRGTRNRCIMFRRTYFELLAVDDAAPAASWLSDLIAARGDGGLALAYAGTDAAATAAALRAAGIDARDPEALARPLPLDGETKTVRFENVTLAGLGDGAVPQFVCVHKTPELTRARHEWQLHANGADDLHEIVIEAADPHAFRDGAARMFGEEAIREHPHGFVARLAPASLAYLTPVGVRERFGTPAREGLPRDPAIAAMSIAVKEVDAAGAILDAAGIDFRETPHGLVLPASAACGIILECVDAHA